MARTPHDAFSGQSDSYKPDAETGTRVDAAAGDTVTLPGSHSVADATILRDGADLVLRTPDGQETTITNYFTTDPAPTVMSGDGAVLTPALAESFATPVDGVQFAQKGSVDDSSPVGVVREVSGDATVTHANGVVEKAQIGTPVYEGDIVETKGDGAVNITFVDDTTFAVSENARLAIDEYVFDPATQGGESNFSVLRGVFVFTSGLIGREDPDDVTIETPVGSIGIRGTTIMGDIRTDGDSQITVVEGAIVVKNGAGEQTLSEQFETITVSGFDSAPKNMGVLDPSQIAQDYTVVRTVSAPLFSTFDDAGTTEAPGDAEPAQTAPADPTADPEKKSDATQDGSTEQVQTAEVTEPGKSTFDAEFDRSAKTEDSLTLKQGTATLESTTTYSDRTIDTKTSSSTLGDTASTALQNTRLPITTDTTTQPTGQSIDLRITGLSVNGTTSSRYGESIAAIGDYDHDGNVDYAVLSSGISGFGSVFLNGVTTPAEYSPALSGATSLTMAAIGDFNGDGIGDIIVGGPGATQAVIYSDTTQINITGLSSTQLTGFSVAGGGDFNGDGYNDVILGGPHTGGTGQAHIAFGRGDGMAPVMTTISGTTGAPFGNDVAVLKDFNGDGFSDFAVSTPTSGKVDVYFGNAAGASFSKITITGITSQPDGIPLIALGDFNGDGKSDLGIASGDTLHVVRGQAGVNGPLSSVSSFTVKVADGAEILNAGAAGDFNGDGYDDMAVAVKNGSAVDVYVVYGTSIAGGTIDLGTAAANAGSFRISLDSTTASNANDIALSTAGDLNGDGFDDLVIGLPDANGGNGGLVIVNGRFDSPAAGTGVIFHGNNANNNFDYTGGTLRSVDGGAGNDTLNMLSGGNIDLRGLGENLSGIEKFAFGATAAQNITIGIDQIFRLLQESQADGILRFHENNTLSNLSTLTIDGNGNGANLTDLGFNAATPDGEYNVWTFGEYQLYIDTDIAVAVTA